MKRHILLIVFFLNILNISGQSGKASYLGVNLLQIPALTMNANLTSEVKPFLSPLVELGYTINYTKAIDFMGYILTPHCKCANDGYDISKQSGGYIKIGAFFNLRNDFKKSNYPHLGLFLTNSIVNEEGIYLPPEQSVYMPVEVNHSKYIIGLSASLGYEFSITNRLKSNIDFQISLPNNNYKTLRTLTGRYMSLALRTARIFWLKRTVKWSAVRSAPAPPGTPPWCHGFCQRENKQITS